MSVDPNADDDTLEREHFRRIVTAFKYYRIHALHRLGRSETYLKSLSQHHQKLLQKYSAHLQNTRLAIDHNYEIVKLIITDVGYVFDNVDHSEDDVPIRTCKLDRKQGCRVGLLQNEDLKTAYKTNAVDMDKVQSTLKQFVRDWSEEGLHERKTCYSPIIDEIEKLFPKHLHQISEISVLVPGAGLGRLAFEIAKRGYICQGNEFSLYMLFASNFVLNKSDGVNLFTLYPWVHQLCNNVNSEDQLRSIQFPDVDPSELPPNSQFSMAAGDFLEIYVEPHAWNCVATCFFIDTANNVLSYIETIWNILKPGGYWINLGPLLYHFADMPSEYSIEPSYEDIRGICTEIGFQVLKEDTKVRTTYAQNTRAMLKYEYDSVFFVYRKPLSETELSVKEEKR